MSTLDLKPSHAPLKKYYDALEQFGQMAITHELGVEIAFYELLNHCARKMGERWAIVRARRVKGAKGKDVVPDATVLGEGLVRGFWEAKDSADDLKVEARKKFEKGYPKDNILFQEPRRALLYQDGLLKFEGEITDPEKLVQVLKLFFEYRRPEHEEWEKAVEEFKVQVPNLAEALKAAIEKERKTNKRFIAAFDGFYALCRQAINPNLSAEAVEGMLIQHLLTERIFRKVFDNPDFSRRNVIAAEIEKVIDALTSRSFNREQFLKDYDFFYKAIERNAENARDYSEKQTLLNTVYERFFQGWSVKEADTHGIVYTPQSIVDFMVRSVDQILTSKFGCSINDESVHILDPFVGTGNFIVKVVRELSPTAVGRKYSAGLHCNEILLMPYYIACMNIEHAYHERTGEYKAFPGICLVDTFELSEGDQTKLGFMAEENAERVEQQKRAPIFVVIGNPPYNGSQMDDNDNNKNRKYPILDARVSSTYTASSKASLKKYGDPYIKALRWATDRIPPDRGIVCLITNHSFLAKTVFDGIRAHIRRDFDEAYFLDLGGNVFDNPKLSGTVHNVFQIKVGVSINFLIRKTESNERSCQLNYSRLDEYWTREQKLRFLDERGAYNKLNWSVIRPDKDEDWLLGEKDVTFSLGLPMAGLIFGDNAIGISTNRDPWVYSFSPTDLYQRSGILVRRFNTEVSRWIGNGRPENVDDFVDYDSIKWSEHLKKELQHGKATSLEAGTLRRVEYRPFTGLTLFEHPVFVDRPGRQPGFDITFDSPAIALSGTASNKPFQCLMSASVVSLDFLEKTQVFPLRVAGTDNLRNEALDLFQAHYKDASLTKSAVFYYVYGVLHDPEYRTRYAANLKRELPRIPFAPDFWAYAKAGQRLAELHMEYEKQKPYPLQETFKPGKFEWRVEKMKLSKDKTQLIYNEHLTLSGIPKAVFAYQLGNRSALEWVVDQYQVSTDKRSGIVNDPNREDDPEYIYRLVRQVITVSLETVALVNALPGLALPQTAQSAATVQ